MKKECCHIALTFVLVAVFGCATMPAPGESRAAPDAPAAAAVDRLVRAYESRDVSGLMALVSARYLEGYGALQTALEDALDTAVSVALDIHPERIWEQEDGTILMDAAWSKTRMKSSASDTEMTSGKVTFIFIRHENDVLKLLSQKGNPVFP